jgi:nucleotide-binding universal stress UspA family protein
MTLHSLTEQNETHPTVILVPLDGSELARASIAVARALLSRVPGRMILFHAYWPGIPADDADLPIEAEVKALNDIGVDASLERRSTPRDEETGLVIASTASELGADLIIMTTHGRGGLGRWLFGSVTEKVIGCSDVPVMITPSELSSDWPGCNRPSVLIALNGSDSAARAIAPAARLARALKAEIILTQIVPESEGNQDNARADEAKNYLLSVSSSLNCSDQKTRTIVRRGEPARAIAVLAQERNVSVIAIGAPSQNPSRGCALGNVAMGIVRRSNVPILVA